MKLLLKTIVPPLAAAALTTAYNPLTHKNTPTAAPTQYPQDPRFPTFTYDTADEPKVEERVDVLNTYMPKLKATAGYVVVTYFRGGASQMPTPDHQSWMIGVAEVLGATIAVFVDDNIGAPSLLPGIHPSLYEYVPEGCIFATVDPIVANKVLGIGPETIHSEWKSFEIREFVVLAGYNLIIVVGDGLDTQY